MSDGSSILNTILIDLCPQNGIKLWCLVDPSVVRLALWLKCKNIKKKQKKNGKAMVFAISRLELEVENFENVMIEYLDKLKLENN